jgi:hypothetical protein
MSKFNQSGWAGKDYVLSVELFVLVIAVVASAVLVSWVSWRAGSGYDFTDEGYYLNSIAAPQEYKATVTEFGFIYHPLYRLVDGDIARLRRANLFITLGLAWGLSFLLLRKVVSENEAAGSWRNLHLVGVAVVLSTSVLALLQFWLPTPNYDSLTLQALLIAGIGIVMAETNTSRISVTGWVLIGISGWMALMAKPTSAAALSIAVALYLAMSGKLRFRLLVLAVATAAILVLLSAWFMDGSVARFILRLVNGAEDAKKIQSGHTLSAILRLDDFNLFRSEKIILAGSIPLVFLATYFGSSTGQAKRVCAAALILLISVVCISVSLGCYAPNLSRSHFLGLQFLAAPLGALLAVVTIRLKDLSGLVARESWALVICLMLFPNVFIFGHNGNYWEGASGAAIFWVLAGAVLLGSFCGQKISWRIFLPGAAAAQLCTATLLFSSMEFPYRQTQPLRQNRDTMQIAGTGSTLLVSRGFAEYVDKLQRMAAAGGFKTGAPMLDLTGHYPGALYALGAKSVGRPWMIGGYKGSDDLATATLDRIPRKDLGQTWILTEPGGPRKLSPDILTRYGVDLTKNYTEVGTIDSPTGSYPESYKQHLLKPAQ